MAEEDNGRGAKFLQPLTSMAPHQMLISGLLAVASLLAIFGMWGWATAPSYQTLLIGEEPTVVSDSIAALEAAGIDYRVGAGGTMLEVRKDSVAEAEIRLASAGISSSDVAGYELLDEQGFSASSFQQRINYQRALEGELTRTILDLDRILAASVHLSIPEDELFSDEEEAPRASVVIDTNGTIGSSGVDGIVNLVAAAVPAMNPDGVTVTDTSGRVLSDGGTAGSTDAFLIRRSLEQQLETSAQTMLIAALGQENAIVRVSADIDLDEAERETVTYDPESQVALREQLVNEQYAGAADDAQGVVGVTDEILNGSQIAAGDGTDYVRDEQTSEYAVDRIRTVERNSAGDVVRLSVAVVVNENVDPAPNIAQISSIVSAAVGLDVARGDSIAVEAIGFDSAFADSLEVLPEEIAASADPLAPIAPYLGIGQTALAILLLIFIVLSLRKGVKALTNSVRQASAEVIDVDEVQKAALSEGKSSDAKEKSSDESSSNDEPLALVRGPLSSNDVMRIIDQQPIEVASLLRSWADEGVTN